MKIPTAKTKHRMAIAVAGMLAGFTAGPAAAAQEKANKPSPTPRQQVLDKYDLDHNKNLDVTESYTLGSDYSNNPKDPLLKQFDTNSDGKMSDQEIMKIVHPNGQPQAKQKPKKKGKAKPQNKPQNKKK